MARVLTILGALVTAVRRDLESVGSFAGNNLFVVSVVFLFFGDPGMFAALNLIIGLVLFIPLSADPLRAIPRERLAIWPLTRGERRLLRILSPWLNPVTWLVAALALWKNISVGLCALAAAIFAIGFAVPSLPGVPKGMWRRLPHFPGPLDQLIRKNLRETLSTLDFYAGLVLGVAGLGWRIAGLLPPAAYLPMTIAVMLALSTYAQTLFGLDGDGGLTRYRLLPVPGWQVLAAKDIVFLLSALVLTLPLAPLSGLAAAFMALAMGHHGSVNRHREQTRGRFSTGTSFGSSIFHVLAMTGTAAAVHAHPPILAPCVLAYAGSTWWFGRALDASGIAAGAATG
jgi:hypothetical protein